jgi:hypothetical protein
MCRLKVSCKYFTETSMSYTNLHELLLTNISFHKYNLIHQYKYSEFVDKCGMSILVGGLFPFFPKLFFQCCWYSFGYSTIFITFSFSLTSEFLWSSFKGV